MSSKFCNYIYCQQPTGTGINLFQFPLHNFELFKKWCYNTGNHQLLNIEDKSMLSTFAICANHFDSDSFTDSDRTELTSTASPRDHRLDVFKPLQSLLKKVVDQATKDGGTNFTNNEMKEILVKEFNIDLNCNKLICLDVYISILKTFLKNWSGWDRFDTTIANESDVVRNELIMKEYKNLKDYLSNALLQADVELGKLKKKDPSIFLDNIPSKSDRVVMEVNCSREQLKNLFYSKPYSSSMTIFNLTPSIEKRIMGDLKFTQIINWPNLRITLNLPHLRIVRTNSSRITHTLINKKNSSCTGLQFNPLCNQLFVKSKNKDCIQKSNLYQYFTAIIAKLTCCNLALQDKSNFIVLLKELFDDSLRLHSYIELVSEYQFYLSQAPYVRYMSRKVTEAELLESKKNNVSDINTSIDLSQINLNNFDLELQEKIEPSIIYQIMYFNEVDKDKYSEDCQDIYNKAEWLLFECLACNEEFDANSTENYIMNHMRQQHFIEMTPAWNCTKCLSTFKTEVLTVSRWQHDCINDEKTPWQEANNSCIDQVELNRL